MKTTPYYQYCYVLSLGVLLLAALPQPSLTTASSLPIPKVLANRHSARTDSATSSSSSSSGSANKSPSFLANARLLHRNLARQSVWDSHAADEPSIFERVLDLEVEEEERRRSAQEDDWYGERRSRLDSEEAEIQAISPEEESVEEFDDAQAQATEDRPDLVSEEDAYPQSTSASAFQSQSRKSSSQKVFALAQQKKKKRGLIGYVDQVSCEVNCWVRHRNAYLFVCSAAGPLERPPKSQPSQGRTAVKLGSITAYPNPKGNPNGYGAAVKPCRDLL